MSAAQETKSETERPKNRRQIAVDEASLEFLNRAARSAAFDETVLASTPAKDMAAMMTRLVSTLRALNIDALLRKQGLLSRVTGADIEAKLKFEISVREIAQELSRLRRKSEEAARMRTVLRETRAQLVRERRRLDAIIAAGKAALQRDADADGFLRERFDRLLTNLIALDASNAMTAEQIVIAEKHLSNLLDRFGEVDAVVFPLWQREALAIAQATAPVTRKSQLVERFAAAHNRLLEQLF